MASLFVMLPERMRLALQKYNLEVQHKKGPQKTAQAVITQFKVQFAFHGQR